MLQIVPQPSGHAFEVFATCSRCGGRQRLWLHELHAGCLPHQYGDHWPAAFLANAGWRTEPADFVLCPGCLKSDEGFQPTDQTPKPEPKPQAQTLGGLPVQIVRLIQGGGHPEGTGDGG
jgi:hypothetical protein